MSLLAGPVVFIDDELDDANSEAYALLQEILATGRPVATANTVPADRESWFEHWQALAFVIIDWDLSPGSMGSTGGATLSAFERKKLYDFLVDLMQRIYCPIFIVSAEDTAEIRRQLADNKDLALANGQLDGRIAVFPKDTVMDKLVEHLTAWVSKSPTLSALKAWESEHDAAKNKLFTDLNSLEPDWPVYIWQAADFDQVDPAFELASVISTNLLNRFNPVAFDAESITKSPGVTSGEARRRVSQGRTSLPGERLSDRMVLPGDIFALPETPEGEVWINVSPACHTVGRLLATHDDGTEVREPIRLHLLRGTLQPWPANDGQLKNMDSKDRTNSIVLHTVLDGNPYKFAFADARIEEWTVIKEHRVARLLPPFITRVQQLHAAYIQSEGLPRVTLALYESNRAAEKS
jgi:hypothetical protein